MTTNPVGLEADSSNSAQRNIVTCGTSLFLTTLEMILEEQTDLKIIHFNPYLPQIIERVVALKPVLVLIEQRDGYQTKTIALLERGLAVAILNPQTKDVMLLGRDHLPMVDSNDLLRLLERIEPNK